MTALSERKLSWIIFWDRFQLQDDGWNTHTKPAGGVVYYAIRRTDTRDDDGLLLFRERKQYLTAVQEALAGAEAARVVLEGVVRRMEQD